MPTALRLWAPTIWTEHVEDQVGEAVDHVRLPGETRNRVDHPEHAGPGRDPVEVTQGTLQAAQHRECRQPSCFVRLLLADGVADLAERVGDRTVRSLRAVTRCPRSVSDDPDELERQDDPRWWRQWRW